MLAKSPSFVNSRMPVVILSSLRTKGTYVLVKLADWLEGDLPGRFAELLDFILPRLTEPTTQQEENDDDDQ